MAEVKPASRMVSGQFINVQRLHVAKLLTDEACDLVGVGRAILKDADWAAKALEAWDNL